MDFFSFTAALTGYLQRLDESSVCKRMLAVLQSDTENVLAYFLACWI